MRMLGGVAGMTVVAALAAAPAGATEVTQSGTEILVQSDQTNPSSIVVTQPDPGTIRIAVDTGVTTVDCTDNGGSVDCSMRPRVRVVAVGQEDLNSSSSNVPVVFEAQSTSGAHVVTGGPAADTIRTGSAGDTINGGLGGDTINGGGGADTVVYTGRNDPLDVDLRRAATSATQGQSGEGDKLASVENVRGGNAADELVGNVGANNLRGGPGGDRIDGQGAADTLSGEDGSDTLLARDGVRDTVDCGDQTDSVTADPLDAIGSGCETVARANPTPPGGGGGGTPQPPPPTRDTTAPTVRFGSFGKLPKLRKALRRGIRARVTPSEPVRISARATIPRRVARKFKIPGKARNVVVARGTAQATTASRVSVRLRFTKAAKRRLKRAKKVKLTVRLTATDGAGNKKSATKRLTLKR